MYALALALRPTLQCSGARMLRRRTSSRLLRSFQAKLRMKTPKPMRSRSLPTYDHRGRKKQLDLSKLDPKELDTWLSNRRRSPATSSRRSTSGLPERTGGKPHPRVAL